MASPLTVHVVTPPPTPAADCVDGDACTGELQCRQYGVCSSGACPTPVIVEGMDCSVDGVEGACAADGTCGE